MKRVTAKSQRRVLRGWVKWAPVVAIPFSILFFHTWLNIQILRADYVLRELDGEAREWSDRLNHTGMAETIHEDPAMLAEQAEQMAFVQPSPGQREMVYYDPSIPLVRPEEENFAVAQLDGVSQPDPAATESLVDQANVTTAPTQAAVPVETPVSLPVALPESTNTESSTAMETPVPVSVPASVPTAVESPVESPATATPATVVTNIVLDLPEEAYTEDLVSLESEMESLESL